jgi:hypothetical protein
MLVEAMRVDLQTSTLAYYKVGRTDNVPRRLEEWKKRMYGAGSNRTAAEQHRSSSGIWRRMRLASPYSPRHLSRRKALLWRQHENGVDVARRDAGRRRRRDVSRRQEARACVMRVQLELSESCYTPSPANPARIQA